MKKLLLLFLIISLLSCENKYEYIEYGKSINGDVSESRRGNIKANSDSIAYLQAYSDFLISKKVYSEMPISTRDVLKCPVFFSLIDPDKKDISKIEFKNIDSLERLIEKRYSIDGLMGSENEKDSVKIKQLYQLFDIQKDEYSTEGIQWVKPKSAPKYVNINSIHCYFSIKNNQAYNFRICIQYQSEDWLFIKTVKFSVDGIAYEYSPTEIKRDNAAGRIWEWSDEEVNSKYTISIVEAISKASMAKIKLIGNKYYDERKITTKELTSIKNTFQYYKALGGVF